MLTEKDIIHAVLQACVDCEIPRSEGLRHLEDAIQDDSEFSMSMRGASDMLSRMKRFFLLMVKEVSDQQNDTKIAADDSGCLVVKSADVLPDVKTSSPNVEENLTDIESDDNVNCDIAVVSTTTMCEGEEGVSLLTDIDSDDNVACDTAVVSTTTMCEGEEEVPLEVECEKEDAEDFDDDYDDGLGFLGMDFGDDCSCVGDEGCPACYMICRTDNFKNNPDFSGPCPYSSDPVVDCKYAPSISFPFAEVDSEASSVVEEVEDYVNEYGFDFDVVDRSERIKNFQEIINDFGSSEPPVYDDKLQVLDVMALFGSNVRAINEEINRSGLCLFFLGVVIIPRHVFDATFALKELTQMFRLGVKDYGNDLVTIKNPFAVVETDFSFRVPNDRERVFVVGADPIFGSLVFDRREWRVNSVVDYRSFTYLKGSSKYCFCNKQTLAGESGSLIVSFDDFKIIGFIKGVRLLDTHLTIVSNVTTSLTNDVYAYYHVQNFEEDFDDEIDEVETLSERLAQL
jgi:hypothetical protein